MIAIAVDDEVLMLGALEAAVKASPDISDVYRFSDCEKALEFVKENSVDIAFLDINMRGMGGLALAKKIIDARPYVYEHGCEAFADGSENQESVKALLQLIDNQKAWFAVHQ